MKQTADTNAPEQLLIVRLVIFVVVFAIFASVLSGCSESAESLISRGDRHLSQGEKQKALNSYREALKIAPRHSAAREKAARLEADIWQEQRELFEEVLYALFVVTSLPLSLLLFVTRTARGKRSPAQNPLDNRPA